MVASSPDFCAILVRIDPGWRLEDDDVDPTRDLEGLETNPESVEQTEEWLESRDLKLVFEAVLVLELGPTGTLSLEVVSGWAAGGWSCVLTSELELPFLLFFILRDTRILDTRTPNS